MSYRIIQNPRIILPVVNQEIPPLGTQELPEPTPVPIPAAIVPPVEAKPSKNGKENKPEPKAEAKSDKNKAKEEPLRIEMVPVEDESK